ncbi:Pentatricopeptide repeat-containing protein [Nymphaea thermarum]|nr:Pentatricopeptide repeat-containing protein [Nymphaea thermarum]
MLVVLPRARCQSELCFFSARCLQSVTTFPGQTNTGSTFLIAACSRLDRSCSCHSMVVKKGFERDTFVKNSLVSMHVSVGAMEYARKLFDGMTEPGDVVLWTTLVGGCTKFGMVHLALKLFDEMPDWNDVTWGVVIAERICFHGFRHRFQCSAGLAVSTSAASSSSSPPPSIYHHSMAMAKPLDDWAVRQFDGRRRSKRTRFGGLHSSTEGEYGAS